MPMCTIWEMAETIRAEEREAAAREGAPANPMPMNPCDKPDASRECAAARRTKNGRLKSGVQAIAAFLTSHRQRTQN